MCVACRSRPATYESHEFSRFWREAFARYSAPDVSATKTVIDEDIDGANDVIGKCGSILTITAWGGSHALSSVLAVCVHKGAQWLFRYITTYFQIFFILRLIVTYYLTTDPTVTGVCISPMSIPFY